MPVDPRVLQYFQNKFNPPEDEEEETEEQGFDGQRLFAGVGDSLQRNARNQMRIHGVNPEGEPSHEASLVQDRERQRKQAADAEARKMSAAKSLYEIDRQADIDTLNAEDRKLDRSVKQAQLEQMGKPDPLKALQAEKLRLENAKTKQELNPQSQSVQQKVKGMNTSDRARFDNVSMAIDALNGMKSALNSGENTFSLIGDNNFTTNRNIWEEAVGRMQSGGAINSDEAARFRTLIPKATDSAAVQQVKLRQMEQLMTERLNTFGISRDQLNEYKVGVQSQIGGQAPQGGSKKPKRVIQNGHEYILNEQTGEYE